MDRLIRLNHPDQKIGPITGGQDQIPRLEPYEKILKIHLTHEVTLDQAIEAVFAKKNGRTQLLFHLPKGRCRKAWILGEYRGQDMALLIGCSQLQLRLL